ncbi:magnesium transporter [Lederbergia citrea]|uniref:Magnesium transporter MgtE n=1 Tax=Lederbergia citrea TaxID=2833581 RepID=A0A942UHB6_9BACI|nr:magnesium transporter [Lederbergia citrea]MBS4177287.1 magnesium transporter [Lederbergia citrea]MBS4203950.1 magnesium transporter [Lederbergia citrea]MBS4221466.1 magnesium transporter [Lederbergia citrea]
MITKKIDEEETLLVIEKLKSEQYEEMNEIFEKKRPFDMAAIFQSLPERHRAALLHHLEESTLASMMQKLNQTHQLELLSKVGPEKANKILALLDTSVLNTLLRKYPKADLEVFLAEMEENDASYIKKMIEYPVDSAGSLMTNRYISISAFLSVAEAIEKIKTLALYSESINHLYIVDDLGKLIGLVSYRDLILADRSEILNNIMLKQVIGVTVSTKRAEILRLLKHYDFSALPVTNDDGVLVGMITFDDMVEIIIHETSDDYTKLSATSKEIDFDTKPFTAAIRRLPWLIILLFIGLVSGSIISNFEATLEKVVALAFFMPLIAGMTGNTGTQSLAVVVRGLAEKDIDSKTVFKLLLREFWVSLMIGVTCGFLISIIAFIWQGNVYLGVVVGGSLLLTLILGTMAGTVIPLILYKFKLDPAVASGPLITTVNDIFSLITYFTIASWFLNKLIQ